MNGLELTLFHEALRVAIILMLPLIVAVAGLGIIIGIVQTIVQVQDQNVSFAPKIALVAAMSAIAGPKAIETVYALFVEIVAALPRLAHS